MDQAAGRERDEKGGLGSLLLLTALVGVGLWLRAHQLGALAFVADEGFQALAVRGILEHGVPRLDTGLVYLRAPLFLYLQAGAATLLGTEEWVLRLPAVLAGVACIPAAYGLGRALFGAPTGLVLATFVALSGWEIELSRYARFYAPFQLAYLLALLLFVRGFLDGRRKAKPGFFAAALVAISLHQLGVMLGACFLVFLPAREISGRRRLGALGLAAGVGALWLLYVRLEEQAARWLAVGAPELTAAQPRPPAAGLAKLWQELRALVPIQGPDLAYLEILVLEHPLALLAWLVPAVVGGAYVLRRGVRERRWGPMALGLVIVLAGLAHQAALALVALGAHLALFVRRRSQLRDGLLGAACAAAAVCLGGYLLWFLTREAVDPRVAIEHQLLGFPAFYSYFLQWFVPGWPLLSLLFAAGCVLLARRAAGEVPHRWASWFVLGAIFWPILLTSLMEWKFSEARYFFHLYPLLLLVVAALLLAGGSELARRWPVATGRRALASAALVAAVVLAAPDLNPLASHAIGARRHTSAKDPVRGVLNWAPYADFHADQKSPARYVRRHRRPGDRVLVVGSLHQAALYRYYAGPVDYVVGNLDTYVTIARGEEGRPVDPVVGAEIVPGIERLKAVVEDARRDGRLWILSDRVMARESTRFLGAARREYLAGLVDAPEHLGEDGKTYAAVLR